jgi:hypothetical protein
LWDLAKLPIVIYSPSLSGNKGFHVPRNGSQDNLYKNYKFHGCRWRVPESNKVRSYNKFIAIRFWMQRN